MTATAARTLLREDIASLIPHAGQMSVLDEVTDWDADAIVARSTRHHAASNPLLDDGQLHCIVLIEYAAQAAAVHAALNEGAIGGEQAAFIGAVRALKLHRHTVPDYCNDLTFTARCVLNDSSGAIYQLSAQADELLLMEARVVMVLP